jgi:hypothetical protein
MGHLTDGKQMEHPRDDQAEFVGPAIQMLIGSDARLIKGERADTSTLRTHHHTPKSPGPTVSFLMMAIGSGWRHPSGL